MTQYRALVGIDYPPNKRVEAGEVVSDLPGNAIKWLLESNLIESTDGKKTPKQETPKEETPKEEPKVEPVTKIDLADGISAEEEQVILETAQKIEQEKA